MMGAGPRRKIYIGSHGSIAMTLEKVVRENPVKNAAKFVGLYIAGTTEEIKKEGKETPSFITNYDRVISLGPLAVAGLYALAGYSYLAEKAVLPSLAYAATGIILSVDDCWRSRAMLDDGAPISSSGIIGSLKSAMGSTIKKNQATSNYS